MRIALAALALFAAAPLAAAEPVAGSWVTASRDGVVQIGACGASLCGRLQRFLVAPPQGSIDVAALPEGVRWTHLAGAGALAGIGFTMSLFVTELAFVHMSDGGELVGAAKQAILVASAVAAALGSLLFVLSGRTGRARAERP